MFDGNRVVCKKYTGRSWSTITRTISNEQENESQNTATNVQRFYLIYCFLKIITVTVKTIRSFCFIVTAAVCRDCGNAFETDTYCGNSTPSRKQQCEPKRIIMYRVATNMKKHSTHNRKIDKSSAGRQWNMAFILMRCEQRKTAASEERAPRLRLADRQSHRQAYKDQYC